ncbi:MAG TPA: DUF4019 domain-containing protein [Casimicrobiaceae bacterium]|nr:DUF4019 domain-containing protein [Casimicrobiaceae bacterium]
MKLRIASSLAPGVVALALLSSAAAADEAADRSAAVAAATQEAQHWLQAMDEQRYAQGWSESAAVVREGRSEQEWVKEFGEPREALGKPVLRELKSADYSTRVRGAPEGEYVTAVYLTKFANIPVAATETLLLTHENGEWRIGGYNLTPAQVEVPPPGPKPGTTLPVQPKS